MSNRPSRKSKQEMREEVVDEARTLLECASTDTERRNMQAIIDAQGMMGDAAKLAGITDRTLRQSRENVRKRIERTGTFKREIHVVTAVQNNTGPHAAFETLQRYCHDRGAQLHCIPYKYKTSTVYDKDPVWWAEPFLKYLRHGDVEIAKGAGLIMGDAQIQATATHPTTRFEAIGGNAWVFLGHPQLQMKLVATAQGKLPKMIHSTGAMTVPNYRDGRAGKAGEFHHVQGAVVIECVGERMHVRQLNADSKGQIYDLDRLYTPKTIKDSPGLAGLVLGDEHIIFASPRVRRLTFGPGGIVETLQPREIVRHDVLDFWSRNHHHEDDPITQFIKHHSGTANVRRELLECIAHLDETTPDAEWFERSNIVASNHHDALEKWLNRCKPNEDPENAVIYHELRAAQLKEAKLGSKGAETIDPFEWFVRENAQREHEFIGRGKEHLIAGIDVGSHGDRGANGARGSIRGLSKLPVKMIIGHSHSPGIDKGVYQVGHSTDGLDYASGGHDSWMNTHGLIYPNGKRSLVNLFEDWRA